VPVARTQAAGLSLTLARGVDAFGALGDRHRAAFLFRQDPAQLDEEAHPMESP